MGTSTTGKVPQDQLAGGLLGAMAYGELSAFGRLSADSRLAPTLRERAMLAKIAVGAFGNYAAIGARLGEMGLDPEDAMLPFQQSFDHFHERTAPGDWFESVMKAYVIDTISADFYRTLAGFLDAGTQQFVQKVASPDHATEALRVLLARALRDDPRLASRLALWGRRLVAEAFTQAQRVGQEHPQLGRVLEGDAARASLRSISGDLAERHAKRMSGLGLSA